ncbi:hypothetical protein [Acrocarpospora sp. B8E8]|uniref:hypothetical protein n=1 Tax=Acrocarpospora sp. B8E8 TaxID=3153572 RepID=UPI00325E522A
MSNVSAVELFTFPVTGQQIRAVMIDDEPVDPKNANGNKVQTTYVVAYGAEQLRLLLIKRGMLPSEQLALLPGF